MSDNSTSKFISLILRHKPETIGITLDEHGWANVDELIEGVSKTHPLTRESLEEIVRTDEKQRYSFNEDHSLIRANQGHSIPVDVELEKVKPPKYLYHGTGAKFTSSIDQQGLIPKSRLYVHLSSDYETAVKVGSRHGKPVVYLVNAEQMETEGYAFYCSVNGVWLTKRVPVKYLKQVDVTFVESSKIVSELKAVFEKEDAAEIAEETILPKHKWQDLQQALFSILQDDAFSENDYQIIAEIIWSAVLAGEKVDTETAIGLLYYRLGNENDPYGNNTIWSIAARLKDLDYANSEYNPLRDPAILKRLASLGIHISKNVNSSEA